MLELTLDVKRVTLPLRQMKRGDLEEYLRNVSEACRAMEKATISVAANRGSHLAWIHSFIES